MTDDSDRNLIDRTLRLVVISEEFSGTVSGGAHVRHRFCELASEWGHDITVLTTWRSGTPRRETVNGIDVVRLTPDTPDSTQGMSPKAITYRILFSLAVLVFLFTWLPRNHIDGLHSTSSASHWAVKINSILFNIPVVNFLGLTQSAKSTDLSVFARMLERVNFRLLMGDVVFCRNSKTRDIVSEYVNSDVRILDGILNKPKVTAAISRTPHVTAAEFASPDAKYVIAAVGRLVPIKNPTGGIDVLNELPPEYELVIVGDGPERDLVERRAQKTDRRAHVLGRLPHDHTLDIIATADALVLTSHAESYSAVVCEALALSTDVFARPIGIVPEINHEHLHVADLEDLPAKIWEASLEEGSPDENFLEQYSIAAYTREVLKVHQKLAN